MGTHKRLYRDIANLGDFNDDERNIEPSMTDPSQDEPIERLVERMVRGELIATNKPRYDFEEGLQDGPGAAFAAMPVHTRDGFDISDAPVILARAEAAVKELDAAKTSEPPAPKVPTAPPPAEKPAEVPDSVVSGE